jgi:hypothetical protein
MLMLERLASRDARKILADLDVSAPEPLRPAARCCGFHWND